jgi:hypothetical protein
MRQILLSAVSSMTRCSKLFSVAYNSYTGWLLNDESSYPGRVKKKTCGSTITRPSRDLAAALLCFLSHGYDSRATHHVCFFLCSGNAICKFVCVLIYSNK